MVRRLTFLLICLFTAADHISAQWIIFGDPKSNFFINADVKAGYVRPKITADSFTSGYLNAINQKEGTLTLSNSSSFVYTLKLGYYFNENKNIGISAGFMYTNQMSTLALDSFHVEYQSVDANGSIFRQSLTSNQGISESIKSVNISVPVMLMLRFKVGESFHITLDGGILVNSQSQNTYNSNSAFDYEAIYKNVGTVANPKWGYDNAAVPGEKDWLITSGFVAGVNPKLNVDSFFTALNKLGHNVGLDKGPTNNTGTVNYSSSSLGYIFEPAIEDQVRNRLFLRLGLYYMSQTFTNTVDNTVLITDKIGDYNSPLTRVKTVQNTSYGISLGLRYFIGKYKMAY